MAAPKRLFCCSCWSTIPSIIMYAHSCLACAATAWPLQAAYIRVPRATRAACLSRGLDFREGVHAAAHAVLNVLPLMVTCGEADVGTEVWGHNHHEVTSTSSNTMLAKHSSAHMTAHYLLQSCQMKPACVPWDATLVLLNHSITIALDTMTTC